MSTRWEHYLKARRYLQNSVPWETTVHAGFVPTPDFRFNRKILTSCSFFKIHFFIF
uniref:Uncharacterized protein n=1 Tax=Anguilla anguilla TaxID=7936 RepID=A0A0E9SFR2_ANGAN